MCPALLSSKQTNKWTQKKNKKSTPDNFNFTGDLSKSLDLICPFVIVLGYPCSVNDRKLFETFYSQVLKSHCIA